MEQYLSDRQARTRSGARLIFRVGTMALLLLVLGMGTLAAAPARTARASGPLRLLQFDTLTMYVPEDARTDEPYLLVNGSKVWGGTMSKPKHCRGDCPVRAALYQLGEIPFSDDIEVTLKDKDGPFDRDDVLGSHHISPYEEANVSHELWFTEDGARYSLTYIITAAPASFECDGNPGVYLYEHAYYRGRCSKFVQNTPNIGWFYIGNDAASSVQVVGGYVVVLYEHPNYKGATSILAADDPNLGNNRIGNDRVSSLIVYR